MSSVPNTVEMLRRMRKTQKRMWDLCFLTGECFFVIARDKGKQHTQAVMCSYSFNDSSPYAVYTVSHSL